MTKTDERILKLIDVLKHQQKIKTINDFCENIGIIYQTIHKIRIQKAHFTVTHIQNICKVYNVDANWIFGITPYVFIGNKNVKLAV
jgi:DNA-binding Xre family transcriptional regulator